MPPDLPARRISLPIRAALAAAGLLPVVVACLAASDDCVHWFVLPVLACGVLAGMDVVGWLGERRDTFDPAGWVGVLALHTCGVAPLLHVAWDHFLRASGPPVDWRPWLGAMAGLNALGLLAYGWARRAMDRDPPGSRGAPATRWAPTGRRFRLALGAAVVAALGAQLWVWQRFGGPLGVAQAYSDRDAAAFAGLGRTFAVAESLPILCVFAYALFAAVRPRARSRAAVAAVLLVATALAFACGGLRGSRSNTVWLVCWLLGILHLEVRPVRVRWLALACLGFLAFMWAYGLFKGAGLQILRVWRGTGSVAELQRAANRTFQGTVLGDLGRSDVQAYLLYRASSAGAIEPAWGRSYVGALGILVPTSVWPDRPEGKVREGTEAMLGPGAAMVGGVRSSLVYGMQGEALLNFGAAAVPPAWGLLGCLVGIVRRHGRRLHPGDARRLLLPLWVLACVVALVGDMDNLVYFLGKNGALPLLVVLAAVRRRPVVLPVDGRPAGDARARAPGSLRPR